MKKPRKEMGFFGMELDQRNRGQRAMEEKTLVTGCREMKLSKSQSNKIFPGNNFFPVLIKLFNLGPADN